MTALALLSTRDDYAKAAEYFRMAADSYAKAYGPSDRRMAEASKRAKAMSEKLGGGGAGGSGTGVGKSGSTSARGTRVASASAKR